MKKLYRDVLQVLVHGAITAGQVPIKRQAKEAGIAAGTYFFVGWCAKWSLLLFAATAVLALVPVFGPVAATALVGAGFLTLAGMSYLVYSLRKRAAAKRVDAVARTMREAQRNAWQGMRSNLMPLLIAGAATFLAARPVRRASVRASRL
jgi:hypothetical protein